MLLVNSGLIEATSVETPGVSGQSLDVAVATSLVNTGTVIGYNGMWCGQGSTVVTSGTIIGTGSYEIEANYGVRLVFEPR